MIRRYLDGYKTFKCIADKCPATCCSGWLIVIDEDSLSKYREDDFIRNRVDFSEECFKQAANKDCAFLRPDGLCEMICEKDETALCDTCRLYPRHIEEFFGVREYSLSVSCPVVSEALLKRKQLFSFSEETDEEQDRPEEFSDFDPGMYQALLECRKEVFAIIASKERSFVEKCGDILRLMRDAQDSMDGLDPGPNTEIDMMSRNYLRLLYELEPLDDDFRRICEAAERAIFIEKIVDMEAFHNAHPDWQLKCENILYYFAFTYMCGAVYDEYIYSMAAQAVYGACMVKMLWAYAFYEKGEALTIAEQAEILHKYSRELEHSTENMLLLEQLLEG